MKIDTNALLRNNGWGDHEEYGTIAKRASELAVYTKADDILDIIEKEFTRTEYLHPHTNAVPVEMIGEVGIDFDEGTLNQIYTASKIPVAWKSALMPDAHVGYALPVGGVIALDNAVSPYFIGFDIACRMTLSIVDISVEDFMKYRDQLAEDMVAVTAFGLGAQFDRKRQHEVMDDELWKTNKNLKKYHTLAHKQLGSSGGGNHFFDAMIGTVKVKKDWMPKHLNVGDQFVAIVTHSGSRGVGHKMATYYANLAQRYTRSIAKHIPNGYEWLSMDTDQGREYWDVMNLMGRYAQANHHLIHHHFSRKSKLRLLGTYENHHNFAWEEEYNGKKYYVHRKGATPSGKGVVGIIPASMATTSYLVEGKCEGDYLNSSSHGAGRVSSRTEAKKNVDVDAYNRVVKEKDIKVIGVEMDETYQAYKDIDRVIGLQDGKNVDVVASLDPKIVIMGGKADDGD